uniref:protein HYPER-SENSITIVITY-RELATED 4-like n=1 Tax=Erigeron canadensis TaxID=72917 RepID=UPI001CB955B0|nr:protein HYPER-SENSITIVITY-RELATED 4-like [Erigeron canadensis]
MSLRSSIKSKIPTATKIISVVASVAATAVAVRKIARDHLPQEFQDYMYLRFCKFAQGFSTTFTMVIYKSNSSYDNEIYNAAELYIAAKMSEEIHRVKVIKNRRQKYIVVTMDINEEFTDVYNGVKFHWSKLAKNMPQLTFHRDHKDMVVHEYLPFIMKDAEMRKLQQKNIKLMTAHTQSSKWAWMAVNLDHPATFETLAMDSDTKEMVMKDLDRFV